jgi:iron complex outermembrane receptor protein
LGNPDLDPETIDVMELVFDYRPRPGLDTTLNFFEYDLKDLIDVVNGKAQNVKDQDGYGAEAEIKWKATDKLRLAANFSWQHSEDADTGARIADAPAHHASIRLNYQATDLCSVNPQANWVADRARAQGDTRDDIDDYTLVDFTLRCNASHALELAAGVRNAFDEDAREPSPFNPSLGAAAMPNDFPLEGRGFYLEVVYRFDNSDYLH